MNRKNNLDSLMEKIVRNKIFESKYYRESCFGLNSETLLDKATELKYIGGTFGGYRHPCAFLCLLYKMLQINVKKEIILQYINNEHYKYITVLGCFYLRLVGNPKEIYHTLEPFLEDFRKIRVKQLDGKCIIMRIDEIIDILLRKKFFLDLSFPFIPSRLLMEKNGALKPRISAIEDFFDASEFQINNNKKDKNENKLVFKKSTDEMVEEAINRKFHANSNTSGKGKEMSLSIEETNKLRLQLGLKPLE